MARREEYSRIVPDPEIASAEDLLKKLSPKQIIKDHPDMRSALMCVLYRSNSLTAIADLFTEAGHKVSVTTVGNVVHSNGIAQEAKVKRRKLNPNSYAIAPELKAQILELFHCGDSWDQIRTKTGVGYKGIVKTLAEHGLNLGSRWERKVKIGDKYGCWEVIAYDRAGYSLCRHLFIESEKVISDYHLYSGFSTGTKELKKELRELKQRLAISNRHTRSVDRKTARDSDLGAKQAIDLTGQRFGRLTVLRRGVRPPEVVNRAAYWVCECDCGNTKTIMMDVLRSGNTKSCGCLKKGRKGKEEEINLEVKANG